MSAPWPVVDLRARITLGRVRGAGLLSAEEARRVDVLLGLDDDAALVVARLTGRRPAAFRVPDLAVTGLGVAGPALARALGAGVLALEEEPTVQAAWASRAVLAAGCARHGLPRTGRRDALADRLAGVRGWDDAPWVQVVDAALIRRLERWATGEADPDRATPFLARTGVRSFVDYTPTGGTLVASRAAWDVWEAALDRADPWTPEDALALLARDDAPPGRLNPRRALRRAVREAAEGALRAGAPELAAAWLDALQAADGPSARTVHLRARAAEASGDLVGAWAVVARGKATLGPAGRVAIAPMGRRLARAVGGAWVPDPPLRSAKARSVRLAAAGRAGPRPAWGRGVPVESAVVDAIARAGRTAWHAEASPWRALWGLLFVDALFAPVPGALPVPCLDRPVDLDRPGAAERRQRWIDAVYTAIDAGQAAASVARALDVHGDARIVGVDRSRWPAGALRALAEATPPSVLRCVAQAQWREGRRAWRGLPDLVVLPGPVVRVDGLVPATLAPSLVFVEVKAPGDTLRPDQAVWHDRLLAAGACVERWDVRPA